MATINNNNKREREEHKEIIISNVEFCMMQYYKEQTEAWQIKNIFTQRKLKKQRQEITQQHLQIGNLQNQALANGVLIEDQQLEINEQQAIIAQYQDMLHHRIQMHSKAETELYKCHELFCELLRAHPELEQEWSTKLEEAVPLNTTETMYDSDEETEPDTDILI